ncbi:MAG TPA: hypothetical protein VNT75_30485 [Symbiobacteriaceae bacterium]|nr:hypothetical protein [Symbiobacteriaceae bacterium]
MQPFRLTHGPPVALAVQLWDSLYDRQEDAGFDVTLQLEGGSVRPLTAQSSGAGIFWFRSLPGAASGEPRGVTLRVTDRQWRFLPVTLSLRLPEGPMPDVLEPQGPSLWRLQLYSSPVRRDLSGMAVVRATLWDAEADRPAAWALLTVEAGENRYTGLADGEGRLCLPFPYPVLRRPLLTEGAGPVPLYQHTWPAAVRIAYSALPPTPDLAPIMAQPPGLICPDPDERLDSWSIRLPFGSELLLRSGQRPVLLVRPARGTESGDS